MTNDAKSTWHDQLPDDSPLAMEYAALEAQVALLAEARTALEDFGDHSVICYDANQKADTNGEYPGCVCGFREALARIFPSLTP